MTSDTSASDAGAADGAVSDRPPARGRQYHHGDLRVALLAATAEEVAEVGLAAASLRRISARAGVSHTAAAHHFGDKRGLLTALAVEGHRRLASALGGAHGDLLALGQAYVRFTTEHPAHFEVMFEPHVLDGDDPELVAARDESFGALTQVPDMGSDGEHAAFAAWAFVHGVSTLVRSGNLPEALGADPVEVFTTLAGRTRFA